MLRQNVPASNVCLLGLERRHLVVLRSVVCEERRKGGQGTVSCTRRTERELRTSHVRLVERILRRLVQIQGLSASGGRVCVPARTLEAVIPS